MLTTDRINDICDGWAVPPVVVLSLPHSKRNDYHAWYMPRAAQHIYYRRRLPLDTILLSNRRNRIITFHELAHHIVFHMGYTRWHLHTRTWARVFEQLLVEELRYSPSYAKKIVARERRIGRAVNEPTRSGGSL